MRSSNRLLAIFVAPVVLAIISSAVSAQSYTVLQTLRLDAASPTSALIQAADGDFYGTGWAGGTYGFGAVFKTDSLGNVTTVYAFSGGTDGADPWAPLLQTADGSFYGTTYYGGDAGKGTVFKLDSSGNLTTLHSFAGSDGTYPRAGLIQATDGNFYGTTSEGGTDDVGTVFKIDAGGNLATLYSFPSGAGNPLASLVQGNDGNFYGTTWIGGAYESGTVFKIDSMGNLTTLHSFTEGDGSNPQGALIQATDGNLYGTTQGGGSGAGGTVFRMDLSGNVTTIHNFASGGTAYPFAGLIQGSDGDFYGTTIGSPFGEGAVFKMDSAGNMQLLVNFQGPGASPWAGVVQGNDGYLYGTTYLGGFNYGIVFKVDTAGNNYTTLHILGFSSGARPYGPLLQAADGNFYGTAYAGGTQNVGTVFKLDLAGNLNILHDFVDQETPSDGNYPTAPLMQGTDGEFYGTTSGGGANNSGTIFKIDSGGSFAVLHSFDPGIGEGINPFAPLVQGVDGNLYGTTANGGGSGMGAVFKVDLDGNLTVLHSFAGYPTDGASPLGGLTLGANGDLYGLTAGGGVLGGGTAFKIDLTGNLTTLHSFGLGDDVHPNAPLLLATNGYFYGTSAGGSGTVYGSVFKMDASGNVITLHNFALAEGINPQTGLVQGADGNFYGTTWQGGMNFFGTVFRMDPAGNVAVVHHFTGSDGVGGFGGMIQGADGNLYGVAQGGGYGSGVFFRLASCAPQPAPDITVTRCLPADTSGFVASAPSVEGDTYSWTVSGGSIDAGQGTPSIRFTSGDPGTLMSVSVLETNASNCAGATVENLQVEYADEPPSDVFYSYVCAIGRNRISVGCGNGDFCPADDVRRDEIAALLLRARHGPAFLPPSCGGVFADVACPSAFANWIERLASEGITSGCGGGDYCPSAPVSRAQVAVLLLKAEHGAAYVPPACRGRFLDVPCPSPFADWIERLAEENVSAGCGGGNYCPGAPVTRGQLAVFLTRVFGLQ
jgi:uncharacterized repeat protein (TIGR03803 family)